MHDMNGSPAHRYLVLRVCYQHVTLVSSHDTPEEAEREAEVLTTELLPIQRPFMRYAVGEFREENP